MQPRSCQEELWTGTAGLMLRLPWVHRLSPRGQWDWGTVGDPIPNPHPHCRSRSLPIQRSPDANAAAKARLILFKLRM